MPPYSDRRPAGSFRSSMRSVPRYDDPEPDELSGPGSDVTESEWGIEAGQFEATPNDRVKTPARWREETQWRDDPPQDDPPTARQQFEKQHSRLNQEPQEELTGWAALKRCANEQQSKFHQFDTLSGSTKSFGNEGRRDTSLWLLVTRGISPVSRASNPLCQTRTTRLLPRDRQGTGATSDTSLDQHQTPPSRFPSDEPSRDFFPISLFRVTNCSMTDIFSPQTKLSPKINSRDLDSDPRSLGYFNKDEFPRKQCIAIAGHKDWNNFILFAIIANCLLMAFLYDPLDVEKYKNTRDGFDIFFTFLFMLEMFIKIIAQGLLFGDKAYLKDGWNVMDGTIVWVSFVCLDFISGGIKGLGGVRAMRGIRPLRTLSKFKSGALFVNTLFTSWVYIWNVFVFLMWFIVLAACSGTVLFMGQLRSRCVMLPGGLIAAAGGDSANAVCPVSDILTQDPSTYPIHLDDATGDPTVCSESMQNCASGYTCCYYGDDAHVANGKIRFDNILWSALITFQGLTVDGWNEVCYLLMDGLGWPVLVWYALVVVCGAFFVMQLLSAVIVTSLQTCSAEQDLIEQLENERQRRRVEAYDTQQGQGGDLNSLAVGSGAIGAGALVANAHNNAHDNPHEKHDRNPHIDHISQDPREKEKPMNPFKDLWESDAMRPIRTTFRLHIPELYDLAETDGFNNAIMGMIVTNTIVMMTRHYPESNKFEFANEIMEWIFNSVFLLEFLIKHLGYGIAGYWSVGWNRLDGIIVLSSVVDMISPLLGAGVELGFMRALRVLRVMRAVRVLKAAPEAMAVMNAMVVSLASMGGFLLVWLIFMLIYALLGTRLYGGACVFELDEDAGRLSFNSFMRAMLTLFVTASGEDGFDVMHWTMDASGNSASLFMISWMIISQIILSLLLALLIDTYSVDDDEEEEEDVVEEGTPSYDADGHEKQFGRSLSKGEQLNRDLIDMEEAHDKLQRDETLRRDASLARVKSDMDTPHDALDAVFAKKGGKSAKSGKSGLSHKSERTAQRYQEKKLTAALESGELSPEEEKKSRSRLQMLTDLRNTRKVHEVALVRQWLYDIEFETPMLDEDGSELPPIVMTAEQERSAKDRLSLKKHFKKKFKLGRHVPANRSAPYKAISVGGDLLANFTAEDLRIGGEGIHHKGHKGHKETVTPGYPVSPEYPDNLSDEASEGGFNASAFSKSMAPINGNEYDTPMKDFAGDDPNSKKELHRQSSAVSSTRSGSVAITILPWDELEWGYRGTGWIQVTNDAYFTNFILFAILWSSIMLAMENPTYPVAGSEAEQVFFGIDVAFTVVFTIEMAFQWLALGIVGYFGSTANKLDFIIVFTAWLSLILELSGVDAGTLTALRSLRLLRILRPLRAVRRLPALRMVVDCTMNALPAIKWIMVLGMFLAMILGLFGMQFFGGKLWSCQFPEGVVEAFGEYANSTECLAAYGEYGDRTLTVCENEAAAEELGEPFLSADTPVTLTECTMPTIITKQECEFYNGTWANTEYNFDNIGQALVVVFITSTADNWQDTMYTGIDSVDVGKNLIYDHNLWNCLYYVIVTMLSCFFWANMFVSTLVDQYTKASEAEGIIALADHTQNAALTQALLLTKQQQNRRKHWVDRPTNDPFVKWCILVASNPWFGRAMMGVIVLNGFALMCLHADQPGWLDDTDYISGIIFQILYCMEVVVLMTAMTPLVYLEDPWNRFDIAIVIAGVIELSVPGDAPWIAVLRTFRIMRLFKIVKGMKELRILMYTIISALPGVSNIGVLLFLLMFMYACLGVTLFGNVTAPFGFPDGLNKYTNFKNWPNAMFTLFVVFTGNWESIFRATYWECEGDANDWGRECTYRYSAPFYFFSYYILANCVLGNLFVSIILDKFTAETTADNDDDTDLVEVVQIAHMLSVFRSMMTQKIRIYQMLTGRLPRKAFMEAEHVYGRSLKKQWDGEVMEHYDAMRVVAGLKNMRGLMMSTYNGDETYAAPTSPEKTAQSAKAYVTTVRDDETGLSKKSRRDGSARSGRSGRSRDRRGDRTGRTDPDRDDAKQRRRKERERDDDDRLPPIDDDYDSIDGDDFMSKGGPTPGPGPRDPNCARSRDREEQIESQNWLSGCSFIPGLDYCAIAPPKDGKRKGDDVE